jgi:hypothetical protein
MTEKPDDPVYASTMVGRMPGNEQDPAASTQAFRAFAGNGAAEAPRQGPSTGLIVGVAAVVVVVLAVLAVLLLG